MTELEPRPSRRSSVERLALVLHDSFVAYHDAYLEVTRAANRFLNREWDEHQDDNTERLGLHRRASECGRCHPAHVVRRRRDRPPTVDRCSAPLCRPRRQPDGSARETFYNSVTRRLFEVVGLDIGLEFLWLGPTALPADDSTRGDIATSDRRVAQRIGPAILEHSLASQFGDLERTPSTSC